MKRIKSYSILLALMIAGILFSYDKIYVQAQQDPETPIHMPESPEIFRPPLITDLLEDLAEEEPMAYIIHKNISKLPELQLKNQPVALFWVRAQGIHDALGMDFEQIKQHATDEKLLNFVKSHIIVGKTHEYMSYTNPPLFKEDYKNLLGDVIHVESKYTSGMMLHGLPLDGNFIYANDVPIPNGCAYFTKFQTEETEEWGETGLVCTLEKALF